MRLSDHTSPPAAPDGRCGAVAMRPAQAALVSDTKILRLANAARDIARRARA